MSVNIVSNIIQVRCGDTLQQDFLQICGSLSYGFFERKFTKTSCVWRVCGLTRISSRLADISQATSDVGLFVETNFLTHIRSRFYRIMLQLYIALFIVIFVVSSYVCTVTKQAVVAVTFQMLSGGAVFQCCPKRGFSSIFSVPNIQMLGHRLPQSGFDRFQILLDLSFMSLCHRRQMLTAS